MKRTSTEVLIGQELVRKFSAVTSLREKLTFYPNLGGDGNSKMAVVAGDGSNRYLSDPAAGRKKNDILLTTGLRLTFGR